MGGIEARNDYHKARAWESVFDALTEAGMTSQRGKSGVEQAVQYVAALRSRVEALEGALRDIARPKYGLQGLIEDGADTEAICTYWSHLAGLYEQAARAALRGEEGE